MGTTARIICRAAGFRDLALIFKLVEQCGRNAWGKQELLLEPR
jgi:hypothetical protein